MRIDVTSDLTPSQLDQWQGLLATAKTSHPEQDPCFAPVLQAEGQEVVFAMGWRGDKLVTVAMFALWPHPFMNGCFSDAMTYSGPVCDVRTDLLEFIDKLQSTALFRKVGRIRITPYWLGEDGAALGPVLAGLGWHVFENEALRHTGLIPIDRTDAQIYENFSKSSRFEYRKAQRLSLTVEHAADPAGAPEILELLNRHRVAKHLGTVPLDSFAASIAHVFSDPQKAAFVILRHEGRILAGLATYRSHHTVHISHYFTDPEELRKLQNLRIAPYIWHQVAVWGKGNGARWIDVEGYKVSTGENEKLYLVHKYKGDLGAVATVRVAGHALILNPFLHLTGNLRDIARRKAKAALAMMPRRSKPATATAD